MRPATIDDIAALTPLFVLQYGKKFRDEYFHWQYFNGINSNKIFVLEKDKEVIGCFGVLPKLLSNGMKALQAADMLIGADHRSKGYFSSLAKFAFAAYTEKDFCFVLPNLNGKLAVEAALGWKTVCRINEWQLDLENNKTGSVKIDHKPSQQTLLRFQYDTKTIEWRFKNPLYHYSKFEFPDNNYIVSKIFSDKLNRSEIVDIVYHSSDEIDPVSVKSFIDSLDKKADNKKIVSCWALPGTKMATYLLSLGFIEINKDRFLCIDDFGKSGLNDPLKWDILQSDTEFY
jgi:hypothetical protein